MATYWSDEKGLTYYDYLLSRYNYAPTTLMFLIGFQRVFGDTGLSDMLTVPEFLITEGKIKSLTSEGSYSSIQKYLASIEEVFLEDTQMVFDIYALRELFATMQFYFEEDCVVPYILLNSNNTKRIYEDFTLYPPERPKEPVREEDMSDNEWKTLYQTYLEEYNTWDVENEKWLEAYNSLNHKLRYQFALGVLYGCVQIGYDWVPFYSGTDTTWYHGSYPKLIQSASDTVFIEGVEVLGKELDKHHYPMGENELFNYLPESPDEDWDYGSMDDTSFIGSDINYGQHDTNDDEDLGADVYVTAVCRTQTDYDFNASYYEIAHPIIVKFTEILNLEDDFISVTSPIGTMD